MKTLLAVSLVAASAMVHAQGPTINLDEPYLKRIEKHQVTIIDSSDIYINDGESKALFYYALVPEDRISGVLIILPSTWEQAEEVLNNNKKLAALACDNGILTIVPSINFNLCMDETALGFLNASFTDAVERYHPAQDKIVMGGFSLGGMNAVRYTEMAYGEGHKTAIRPAAVYGVDPPLDLVRLYHTFERTVEKNLSGAAVGEASSYLGRFDAQLGGNPEQQQAKYTYYSMYSRTQAQGGNAKYLETVPVRIYCDPDIDWHLKNRQADFYDLNALDQTAMINELQLRGNRRAEFINALGKGYRPNGMRHPHSWSIVEPEDCIDWILKCLN